MDDRDAALAAAQRAEREEREWAELRARVAQINRAGSESLPLDVALEILRDEDAPASVRRAVLGRRDIPDSAVAQARTMADPGVRSYAVGMPGVSLRELAHAADDESWQVRSEVANHPQTPVEILMVLAEDTSSVVRRAVMARPELPVDVLVGFVVRGTSRLDAEVAVRQTSFQPEEHVEALMNAHDWGAGAVLQLESVPATLVRRYAMDDHSASVRIAALRKGAPRDVAAPALLTATDERVRIAALLGGQCHPEDIALAAGDTVDEVRVEVAKCPDTPTAAVDALLGDTCDAVRRAAAHSPNASPEALDRCVAQDPHAKVRRAAVANTLCPATAVARACEDPRLVHAAVGNSACPPEGLFAALQCLADAPREAAQASNDADRKRIERTAKTVKDARRRLAPRRWTWLAERPLEDLHADDLSALLARHLDKAASDPRIEVRMGVALHRDVSDAVLLELASDPDEAVRRAVTHRILGAAGGSASS